MRSEASEVVLFRVNLGPMDELEEAVAMLINQLIKMYGQDHDEVKGKVEDESHGGIMIGCEGQ